MSNEQGDLQALGVTKDFPSAHGTLRVLDGVNLGLRLGEAAAITGPSGSGKSTLLYILGALDTPTSGTVRILGDDPFAMDKASQSEYRNANIGFIFQDHHLLPQCTVLENVLIPTLAGSGAGKTEQQRARGLLERVRLGERITHRPAELSGGEKQRVAVCRALINEPVLLLADEPTGNLDRKTADSVASLLLELHKEQNTLLVCVTHSIELAERFPRRFELLDGVAVEQQ